LEITKHKQYNFLDITENELKELNKYIDYNKLDIELNSGENILNMRGLFEIYKYLKPIQYHNSITLIMLEKLEKHIEQYIK
jgi:hypothetical protein